MIVTWWLGQYFRILDNFCSIQYFEICPLWFVNHAIAISYLNICTWRKLLICIILSKGIFHIYLTNAFFFGKRISFTPIYTIIIWTLNWRYQYLHIVLKYFICNFFRSYCSFIRNRTQIKIYFCRSVCFIYCFF